MKSLSKFLPLSITLLFLSLITFAQDTTKLIIDTAKPVIDSTLAPVVKSIISAAETKYVWVAGVLAVIVLLDHILAAIPSVKASSTFQLITNWITSLTSSSKTT